MVQPDHFQQHDEHRARQGPDDAGAFAQNYPADHCYFSGCCKADDRNGIVDPVFVALWHSFKYLLDGAASDYCDATDFYLCLLIFCRSPDSVFTGLQISGRCRASDADVLLRRLLQHRCDSAAIPAVVFHEPHGQSHKQLPEYIFVWPVAGLACASSYFLDIFCVYSDHDSYHQKARLYLSKGGAMSGELLIALKNIGVSFNIGKSIFRKEKIQAIQDVSMELYRGDSLGVIGRNGAGKSTLLQVLGGIIRPDTGTIINNNATTSLMALQAGFDPELSGRLNILVSGMLLGFRKADIKKNMDKIIAFSELENFIDRPVKAYSTGMKARLGFSLALEMNPDVLLIDEVLGVGDVQFRKKAVAVMKEKFLSEQTIVLVSHDAITVKTLCNRAVWIENGVTRMAGPSDQVVTAYEDYVKNPPKKLSI